MDTIFTILISIFPTMVSYIGTFFIGLIIGWLANTIITNKKYKTLNCRYRGGSSKSIQVRTGIFNKKGINEVNCEYCEKNFICSQKANKGNKCVLIKE